jgi:hypothetical protein
MSVAFFYLISSQQALEQQIQDITKELKTNGDLINHWQAQHDSLILEEIE